MRAFLYSVVLFGGSIAISAHAATDATQWLNRLALAEQRQSFQGTFIYERSGGFSTHEIWHRARRGRVSERLIQLDGLPLEVVRKSGATQCVSRLPIQGLPDVVRPPKFVLDPLKLMSWYTLAVAGDSRVAGRGAVVVTVTPKDQQRYGFELYLDKQTGLPLKSLLLGEKNQLLERFQFTHFVPTDPDDMQLTASKQCKAVRAPMMPRAMDQQLAWRSDWLPPGFELTRRSTRVDSQRKVMVASLMYGDGLSRFSVFIEPLGNSNPSEIHTRFGPTAAVSRRQAGVDGEMLVTVVGEIPIGTAERVALSMRAVSDENYR